MAAVVVWRRAPEDCRLYPAELPQGSIVRDLLPFRGPGIFCCDFYVTCNGRRVSGDESLQNGFTYSVQPRLYGGKGGFGSMLRALGAQIEKTTNREACRDLSGRRLRDVNHEKAMAEWIKKQAEREAEKEQRRLERLKRKLEEPKHFFTDPDYHQQRSDMSERLEDSVIKGLQASSSTVVSPESSGCRKRKSESPTGKGKSSKKFLWTGMEGLEVSSSSDSDSESPSTSSCHSAEQRMYSSVSDSDEQAECSTSMTKEENPESSDSVKLDAAGGEEPVSDPDQMELHAEAIYKGRPVSDPDQTELLAEAIYKGRPVSEYGQAELVDEDADKAQPVSESGQAELVDNGTDKAQPVSESGQAELVDEAADKGQPVAESGQAEHSEVIPEPEKPIITPDPPIESSTTDSTAPSNLMSFSSAVELEALGLDKLKTELMALGLKCGGTLQERAARLFSVRGLSRDRIHPALFAKPAKAKKK